MVRAVGALVTEQSQQGPKARSIPAWGNAPGKAWSESQNKGWKPVLWCLEPEHNGTATKRSVISDFRANYPILYSKGRTVVTAMLAAREADTDKLSKLAAW